MRGRILLILFEKTPNPDALKFLPHARLTDGGGRSYRRDDPSRSASPLAELLFELADVRSILIARDHVTVTRDPAGAPWSGLRGLVVAALAEHLASGRPAILEADSPAIPADQIETEIRQVLGLHVRPGAARDGGDILFERFDAPTGVLWIRMEGACGGCPSSRMTLKSGVERIVRRYVPEVTRVEEHVGEAPDKVAAARPQWLQNLRAWGQSRRQVSFRHNGEVYRDEGPAGPLRS
jgi:Fe-S cluster biogenesis protein NfuA